MCCVSLHTHTTGIAGPTYLPHLPEVTPCDGDVGRERRARRRAIVRGVLRQHSHGHDTAVAHLDEDAVGNGRVRHQTDSLVAGTLERWPDYSSPNPITFLQARLLFAKPYYLLASAASTFLKDGTFLGFF